MLYSINIGQFAKSAEITFGAVEKGNLLLYGFVDKSGQTICNKFKKVTVYLGGFAHFESAAYNFFTNRIARNNISDSTREILVILTECTVNRT
jgi:hypothetical protein